MRTLALVSLLDGAACTVRQKLTPLVPPMMPGLDHLQIGFRYLRLIE